MPSHLYTTAAGLAGEDSCNWVPALGLREGNSSGTAMCWTLDWPMVGQQQPQGEEYVLPNVMELVVPTTMVKVDRLPIGLGNVSFLESCKSCHIPVRPGSHDLRHGMRKRRRRIDMEHWERVLPVH